MSNYFRTLKRLESESARDDANPEQAPARIQPVRTPAPAQTPAPESLPQVRPQPVPEPPAVQEARVRDIARIPSSSERTIGSYSSLFDNLRVIGNGAPASSVVLAGASSFEGVSRLADGLAAEINRHRLKVAIATLSRGQSYPTLRLRLFSNSDEGEKPEDLPIPIDLDLRSGPVPTELIEWLTQVRRSQDVLIIEAPPLGLSVDAAVVARACEGLMLVVQPRETSKDALFQSVERAESVGCNVLGLITHGAPERVPQWLRNLVSS
jgi:Mrp family chromosome partitioning ATPase